MGGVKTCFDWLRMTLRGCDIRVPGVRKPPGTDLVKYAARCLASRSVLSKFVSNLQNGLPEVRFYFTLQNMAELIKLRLKHG